jgi:hypothetical protein
MVRQAKRSTASSPVVEFLLGRHVNRDTAERVSGIRARIAVLAEFVTDMDDAIAALRHSEDNIQKALLAALNCHADSSVVSNLTLRLDSIAVDLAKLASDRKDAVRHWKKLQGLLDSYQSPIKTLSEPDPHAPMTEHLPSEDATHSDWGVVDSSCPSKEPSLSPVQNAASSSRADPLDTSACDVDTPQDPDATCDSLNSPVSSPTASHGEMSQNKAPVMVDVSSGSVVHNSHTSTPVAVADDSTRPSKSSPSKSSCDVVPSVPTSNSAERQNSGHQATPDLPVFHVVAHPHNSDVAAESLPGDSAGASAARSTNLSSSESSSSKFTETPSATVRSSPKSPETSSASVRRSRSKSVSFATSAAPLSSSSSKPVVKQRSAMKSSNQAVTSSATADHAQVPSSVTARSAGVPVEKQAPLVKVETAPAGHVSNETSTEVMPSTEESTQADELDPFVPWHSPNPPATVPEHIGHGYQRPLLNIHDKSLVAHSKLMTFRDFQRYVRLKYDEGAPPVRMVNDRELVRNRFSWQEWKHDLDLQDSL